MSAPSQPWANQNVGILRSSSPNPVIPQNGSSRNVPLLPPRPNAVGSSSYSNSYSPYSSYSGVGYNSYSPFSSMYNSYGSYGGYGYNNYNMYGNYGMGGFNSRNDAEGRFIQFAESSTRSTFANVESVVRAFSSMAMMLDNTFFAMTSSFRAVLSVAENFGRLRSVFGQIWYSINLFRLFKWLYRKCMSYMGYKVPEVNMAWEEAAVGAVDPSHVPSGGANWSTLAFFGVIISIPYFISKLLPKYEDKSLPENWKSPGVSAKAAFDFIATSNNELSINTNDEILLAPKSIQDEMKLTNTGWAFAVHNGKSGVVPLNYIVIMKKVKPIFSQRGDLEVIPVPRSLETLEKPQEKKVTFGKNEIINIPSNETINEMDNQIEKNPINFLQDKDLQNACSDQIDKKSED